MSGRGKAGKAKVERQKSASKPSDGWGSLAPSPSGGSTHTSHSQSDNSEVGYPFNNSTGRSEVSNNGSLSFGSLRKCKDTNNALGFPRSDGAHMDSGSTDNDRATLEWSKTLQYRQADSERTQDLSASHDPLRPRKRKSDHDSKLPTKVRKVMTTKQNSSSSAIPRRPENPYLRKRMKSTAPCLLASMPKGKNVSSDNRVGSTVSNKEIEVIDLLCSSEDETQNKKSTERAADGWDSNLFCSPSVDEPSKPRSTPKDPPLEVISPETATKEAPENEPDDDDGSTDSLYGDLAMVTASRTHQSGDVPPARVLATPEKPAVSFQVPTETTQDSINASGVSNVSRPAEVSGCIPDMDIEMHGSARASTSKDTRIDTTNQGTNLLVHVSEANVTQAFAALKTASPAAAAHSDATKDKDTKTPAVAKKMRPRLEERVETEDVVNMGAYKAYSDGHKEAPVESHGHVQAPSTEHDASHGETPDVAPHILSRKNTEQGDVETEDGTKKISGNHNDAQTQAVFRSPAQEAHRDAEAELLDSARPARGITKHQASNAPAVVSKNTHSEGVNQGSTLIQRHTSEVEASKATEPPVGSARKSFLNHPLCALAFLFLLLPMVFYVSTSLPQSQVILTAIEKAAFREATFVGNVCFTALVGAGFVVVHPFELLYNGRILDVCILFCMLIIMTACVRRIKLWCRRGKPKEGD